MKSKPHFKILRHTLGLLLLMQFTLTIKAQTMPMFRGNNSHTGIFDSCGITNPTLLWKFRTDGQIYSSPVVNNDKIYIGSNDNHLYALNSEDGSMIWKFKTNGRIKSTPCIDQDLVYFGSFDSTFYAVEAATGKERWKFRMRNESFFQEQRLFGMYSGNSRIPDPWDFYFSSPVVQNSKVYFGSGDSSIYCLNKSTGDKIWEFKTQGVVHSSPAISDGILYCGSWDSKIYALDSETGSLVWKFQTGIDTAYHCFEGIQASPVIADGVLYIGSRDAAMYALNAKTGVLIWKTYDPGMSWFPSSCAVKGDFLYCGSSDSHKFYRINRKTGYIDSFIYTHSYTFSSPAISGNTAFIGSANGRLFAFDTEMNRTKWLFLTDAAKSSLFLTSEGKANEHVNSDIIDYNNAWENIKQVERMVCSNGSVLSSPFIANNTLYFAATDGYVYALKEDKTIPKSIDNISKEETHFSIENTKDGSCLNYSVQQNNSKVRIRILELRNGKYSPVVNLYGGQKDSGQYSQIWDRKDRSGQTVKDGTYFFQIVIGDYSKFMLCR